MLPVISFGARPADDAALKEVLKTLLDNGGRVVDVLHGGLRGAGRPHGCQRARDSEQVLLDDAADHHAPVRARMPPPPKPDPAAVKAAIEEKFATFKVPKIDLVMVAAGADMPTHLAVLREMKKEGASGTSACITSLFPPNAPAPAPATAKLEAIMRNEPIDFIGTDYSVGDRRVEEKILPLAQERKIGVMAYFPFDRGRLFQRASSTPLPEWAAEFDAKTWAQFFLKYVISHPAVTVARTGTTKAAHMLDNIGGGIGRLPDEAMRKRMAAVGGYAPPDTARRTAGTATGDCAAGGRPGPLRR